MEDGLIHLSFNVELTDADYIKYGQSFLDWEKWTKSLIDSPYFDKWELEQAKRENDDLKSEITTLKETIVRIMQRYVDVL